VTRGGRRSGLLLLLALAGCATRSQVVQQDRQLRSIVQDQRRQLQEVQRELERLRADMEEGHGRHPTGAPLDDRVTTLEGRVAELERAAGTSGATAPTGATGTETTSTPVTPPPPSSTLRMTTPTMPPPTLRPQVEDDPWRREIAREQTAAGAVNVPERAEYLGILDVLARQDCARAVPQLNTFASTHKDSALSDNALYWAARCYALRGDQNQAVSKFYDVVTRYPKGDKAPAALWAQGSLFVEMGDSPDARLAFSKLIRDYPSSEEASRARQKLTELEN
jgi:tol-pal system protein YbgF